MKTLKFASEIYFLLNTSTVIFPNPDCKEDDVIEATILNKLLPHSPPSPIRKLFRFIKYMWAIFQKFLAANPSSEKGKK